MTDAIIERLHDPRHRRLLEFLRYTIAADLAREKPRKPWEWGEPEEDFAVDVERLFASVDLLVDRGVQPWSPFVATWHPGLESFAPAPTVSGFDLSSELRSFESALNGIADTSRRSFGGRGAPAAVSRALSKVIESALRRSRPSDVSALLAEVRGEMLRSLFDLLNIDDPHRAAYLTPLIELGRAQKSLTIATLNYDIAIENAAELLNEPCDTAIETWLNQDTLIWPESGLRLLKLHGSIDWVAEGSSQEAGELPRFRIRKVAGAEEKRWTDAPAVVFGEVGKLRSGGPYLELLLAWSAQLQAANRLLVVGYSFRDDHVNEVIARWFNADRDRRIVVVDPNAPANASRFSFAWYLAHVDDAKADEQPGLQRFWHVPGTTAQALKEGIATAELPSA